MIVLDSALLSRSQWTCPVRVHKAFGRRLVLLVLSGVAVEAAVAVAIPELLPLLVVAMVWTRQCVHCAVLCGG